MCSSPMTIFNCHRYSENPGLMRIKQPDLLEHSHQNTSIPKDNRLCVILIKTEGETAFHFMALE